MPYHDAEVELAAALQGIPLEQAKLQQRMRRAQGLMETPLPQGQQVGRVYRAASPLEALATALSRGLGARDMRQAEQEWGGLSQRAEQAGLARMRMQMAEKERGFGLQERGLARQEAAEISEAQRRAEQSKLEQQRLGIERERLGQEQWSAIADPVTGGIVMYNRKTGERQPLGPGGGMPGAAAPVGGALPTIPGKPTEAQRKAVAESSENISKIGMALGALEQAPGAYGGLGNFAAGLVGQAGGVAAQSALNRRLTPAELRTKNYVTNIVSEIINQRAGANVTLREELRQQFLPQDTDNADQVRQKLSDLRAMVGATYKAQGGTLVPDPGTAPSPAPVADLRKKYGL